MPIYYDEPKVTIMEVPDSQCRKGRCLPPLSCIALYNMGAYLISFFIHEPFANSYLCCGR